MQANNTEQLYNQRLKRYVTAMKNGKPDRVPIRPFMAEFTAKYAGFTNHEVTIDLEKAFEAARKCATDFELDAAVPNMVHMWGGSTAATNLNYYSTPGLDIPETSCFQYKEPPEDNAYMKADEYDALIEDPTGFLFNVWFPRASDDVVALGEPSTYRNNLAFLKGGMSFMQHLGALGTAGKRFREECGTVPAISGLLKAPLDIITDKLRGYVGMCYDLMEQPDKVLKACEAMAPHLTHTALAGADPEGNVPISIWMHRGAVPFVTMEHFKNIYWATLKPIIEEIWSNGHQVLFYGEGKWYPHLESFLELPEGSIVYHCDKDDVFEVHKKIGHKFCISGGVPNVLMSFGTEQEVRDFCKRVIDEVAIDGGYIMDAEAIMQDDVKTENLRAMVEFTREYGVY